MAVPDDQYEVLLARARRLRRRVDELGAVTGTSVDQYVEGRLSRRHGLPNLSPPQNELADEILVLLQNPELSPMQGAYLERVYFGRES